MRQLARFLLLASCLTFAFTATAKEPLRIGLSPDYPPLAYKDHGQLTGIDVAAAEVLGQKLGRKPEFVEKSFNQLIPALQAGEIDIIMSGMTITPERSEKVSFSKPYLHAGQMAIIRFADAGRFGFKGAMFRPDARVAVQKHTTSEDFAAKSLPNASVTHCDSSDEAFTLLKSGKVDFFLHDAATSWSLSTDKDKQDLMSLNTALTDEQLGWAVKKDNAVLLQSVNQQLDIMQKNGMLRAIISKWIPVTVEVTDAKPEAIPATLPKTPAASSIRTSSGNK
ncbi:MAG TPA: transporter substrate-binding domain-containing protein [Pseudomonadales bacterium]|nr:transporter substrate-binding domain-containing protein [Pseudomonadales bacterium]